MVGGACVLLDGEVGWAWGVRETNRFTAVLVSMKVVKIELATAQPKRTVCI
jgi:hypothetical protein